MNDNGQRLLELCTLQDLCVTNSYFQSKPQHKVSWRHPRSKRWHQLDLILTRRKQLSSVLTTRSYHSADCDTDHSLVCCKIRLQPKKLHRVKPPGKPRIDTAKASHMDMGEKLCQSLIDALAKKLPPEGSAEQQWDHLRNTIHDTALSVLGRKTRKSKTGLKQM